MGSIIRAGHSKMAAGAGAGGAGLSCLRLFLSLLLVLTTIISVHSHPPPTSHNGTLRGSCPNYKFEDKHVCKTCETPEDALEFSRAHRGEPNTYVPLNTVFDGHDIDYVADYYDNEDSCLIINAVQVWNCYHDGDGYWTNCRSRGYCTAQSAMSNGHFWDESLDCY